MNILVCVKQVTVSVENTNQNKYFTLGRQNNQSETNSVDRCALELAFRLKRGCGRTIAVFTMGGERAANMLRKIVPLTVDRPMLLTDKALAGSDIPATATVLSKAARYLGEFDFYIIGCRAFDGET